METKLYFATGNLNKVQEVNSIASALGIEVQSCLELGPLTEVIENGSSFSENALIKAMAVHDQYLVNVFAEDSGLEVMALDNAPGIFSGRYSGSERNDTANNELLLKNMKSIENRRARFVTVIALVFEGKIHYYEGIAEGNIGWEMKGDKGFGYDSLFVPQGYNRTFAQMGPDVKNKISHRAKAFGKLFEFLEKQVSFSKDKK
jgi:XTP/dITP diphosphohydrolase